VTTPATTTPTTLSCLASPRLASEIEV
jgi:hypothetical protein